MDAPAHNDLVARYGGDFDVIYQHLLADQESDLFTYKMSVYVMYVAAIATGVGVHFGWDIWQTSAFITLAALERAIFWGRETSNRNTMMHTLTFQRQLSKAKG